MPFDSYRRSPRVAPSPLQNFLSDQSDALTHAARLLGGGRGLKLVADLMDDLQRNPSLSRRGMRLAQQILDLLQLEHVGDPDREEAGYFAAIDPCDPVVSDICLLSDGFATALQAAITNRSASKIAA